MASARTYLVFLIVLLALLVRPGWLGAQVYRFDHIDTEDGLSNNIVFSFYQDQEGYLWIGTNDGLNRYDGYTFKVYRHDRDNPTSLSNNTVRRIVEDPYGNQWVRTQVGWGRFDRQTEQFFHRGPWLDSIPPYPPGALIHEKRHFWLFNKDGLYRYDPALDALRRVVSKDEDALYPAIDYDQTWMPLEDRQGTLWVGTKKGVLYRYVPSTEAGTQFISPWLNIHLRFVDDQGRIWFNHNEGTSFFDPDTESFSLPLPSPFQYTILQDRDGFYWASAPGGFYRYDQETQKAEYIALTPAPINDTHWEIHEDHSGALWVSSLSGLYRHDPNTKLFTHRAHTPAEANSLSHNTVMAIWESSDGVLWVGTFGGGLNRIDPDTGAVTVYRHRADDPSSLCNDGIWALYEDRRGKIWVGTNDSLCAFDPHTGRFQTFPLPISASWPALRNPEVNVIREDHRGRLWIGTAAGLHRLDPQSGAVTSYTDVFAVQGTIPTFIQALLVDQAGDLWIGTSISELYRLDVETEAVTAYPAVRESMPVANEGLLMMHQDHAGVLWLSSIQGLTRFDPQTGATRHYTKQDGLPASVVYALLEDDQHRLWVSTNNGLARFVDRYPAAPSFRAYASDDGLGNTEFNRRAAFRSPRGTFYFGGMNGLTSFEPEQIRDNPYRPPVVLTAIETSNRDTTVSIIPYKHEHLVLSYQDYTVSFEFAALNFTNPAQNQYAYQLEGFDNDWIASGDRRRVQYTNIPPGDYTFRVKASNNDGLWNEDGVALRLTVTPPFWQTWWFRTGVGLLLLGTVVSLVRYFSTRTLREQIRALETQRHLQQERERISRDLHDHVGAQVSNMISGIELINLNSRAGNTDSLQPHLAALDEDARRTMAQLRETIWTLHHDAVSLEALGEQLRRFASRQQRYRTHPLLHCSIGGDPEVSLSPTQALSLFRIAQEALSNAIKHAEAANVYLAIETPEPGYLALIVRDDGAFRETDTHDGLNGYGLNGMKHRAHELGGTFALSTNNGTGTTVRVTLPVG